MHAVLLHILFSLSFVNGGSADIHNTFGNWSFHPLLYEHIKMPEYEQSDTDHRIAKHVEQLSEVPNNDDEKEKTSPETQQTKKDDRLFDPLIADPRWPHFSIAYQYYIDDDELENVGATSFGETLPLYRDKTLYGGIWQIGIQAAVFAVFDLDGESSDLINADYWVGFPVTFRKQEVSFFSRIYHQSSHIGDEYILRSRIDRVNLSYEAVDIKVSYDFSDWLRIYSGRTICSGKSRMI
jgi:hypothetical protein